MERRLFLRQNIISIFQLKEGAKKCAGLDVRRYDIFDLKKNLPEFELIISEEYTYLNPKNDPRPYIYTLFKKKIQCKREKYLSHQQQSFFLYAASTGEKKS